MSRRPSTSIRTAAAIALLATLLLPLQASAAAPDGAATETPAEAGPSRFVVGFDAVILRPIGFMVLMVGAAAFVPAALVTLPNGRDSVETALETFVTAPAHEVFERPLGDFG